MTDWHQKWKKGEIGFHQESYNLDMIEHVPSLIKKHHCQNVFVPLCGKTSDMIWLQKQGLNILGSELSDIALQDFVKENHLSLTHENNCYFNQDYKLYQGDMFNLTKDQLCQVDFIYDRASLIALPAQVRQKYAQFIIEKTVAKVMFLITLSYEQDKVSGPPYSVPQQEVQHLYSDHFHIELTQQINIADKIPLRFQENDVSVTKNIFVLTRS